MKLITKSDYILWRDCPHNAWMKKWKPEIYNDNPLSEFELHLIESGNMVEEMARKRFPDGILVEGRGEESIKKTQELLKTKEPGLYPEGVVSGNFFTLTQAAVIRFQEKYRSEVLTPLGLTQGTGYVGASTRAKINFFLNP